MKTNRIYAVGEKTILELDFQKTLDYPDEVWVRLCQKHYPDEKITKVVDAKTHHLCKYCGGIAKAPMTMSFAPIAESFSVTHSSANFNPKI